MTDLSVVTYLRGLGPGRGAHVQTLVVRLCIEREGGDHGHGLLAGDVARVRVLDHPLVQGRQAGQLADSLAVGADLVAVFLGVPGQGLQRLDLCAQDS